MERQKIYCEIGFYEQFIKSYPTNSSPSDASINKLKYWINFYSFLSRSDIFFNISSEQFESLTINEYWFKSLWKKSANGECGVEFIASEFPAIIEIAKNINNRRDFLDAIYLTCTPLDLCEEFEKSFGIKVICFEKLFENDELFNIHIESIESGSRSHTNWRFLETYKHVCNSLAIVDNYILADKNNILENLVPILDSLLPKNLKASFHISVFAKKEIKGGITKDFKSYHDLIKHEIERIRPELNFTLGIFQLRREIHDRNLITNNYIIESGSGFNLFKRERALNQTKIIGFYPSFVTNANTGGCKLYFDLRKSLRKIYHDACQTDFLTTYWGVKDNRLFD